MNRCFYKVSQFADVSRLIDRIWDRSGSAVHSADPFEQTSSSADATPNDGQSSSGERDGIDLKAPLDEAKLRATLDYLARFSLPDHLAGRDPWGKRDDESEALW